MTADIQSTSLFQMRSPPAGNYRILLVEDNPDHQLLERRALEGLGADTSVVAVASAPEALAALGPQRFDLVVADYRMPGMDGLEFLRELNECHAGVPVIIVTGLGNERVAVEALKQGACDYLIKESGYLDLLLAVAERTITTSRARRQLEEENRGLQQQLLQAQKMESIGTLAGGIAHDFNNLLQGVLGYASLALQCVDGQSEVHRYLRTILETAERAASLTAQMLTFSRRKEPRVEPVNVNQLIEESLRMLRRMIPATIEIQTRQESDLWTVEADATQIEQVLVNICVNARDAMPAGGSLSLETKNCVVTEAEAVRQVDAVAGRYTVITISDTGEGMTPVLQERIFEPFFTTKGVGEGTGLGLAVVYGIVHSHKGWIEVHSEPGRGSIFKIFLPAVEKQAVREEPIAGLVCGGSEMILVVDDEQVVRDLACETLRVYGYHTLIAHDGEEAVGVYREHMSDIDLVLLDLTMPKLDGLECAKRLKILNPAVRLVACSGYSVRQNGTPDERVHAFVPKPYTPDQLARVVRNVLDESCSSYRVVG